jgi:hypothetical protein
MTGSAAVAGKNTAIETKLAVHAADTPDLSLPVRNGQLAGYDGSCYYNLG